MTVGNKNLANSIEMVDDGQIVGHRRSVSHPLGRAVVVEVRKQIPGLIEQHISPFHGRRIVNARELNRTC